MALTPEDVVNKRFQPTKFREGYDQDEVDDFLDEIVVELRRLTQENDDLRKKVAALESGAPVAAAPYSAAPKAAVKDEKADDAAKGNKSEPAASVAEEKAAPAAASAPAAPAATG